MDNWYSSCRLYDYLHNRKTMACGTIRSNRGVPSKVKNAQLAVGEISPFLQLGCLCIHHGAHAAYEYDVRLCFHNGSVGH